MQIRESRCLQEFNDSSFVGNDLYILEGSWSSQFRGRGSELVIKTKFKEENPSQTVDPFHAEDWSERNVTDYNCPGNEEYLYIFEIDNICEIRFTGFFSFAKYFLHLIFQIYLLSFLLMQFLKYTVDLSGNSLSQSKTH